MKTTIVASATAMVSSGVAIVRLSGNKSFSIAKQLTDKKIEFQKATYTKFVFKKEIIDFGLVIFFQNPNSFTGEDVVEFHCHGSIPVVKRIIEVCIKLGAKLASPGEFSQRAFLNNKIDLVQAEAIADLISSTTLNQTKACLNSLKGDYSNKINDLKQKLIELRIEIEATIDFTDQDIEFIIDSSLAKKLDYCIQNCEELIKKTKSGITINSLHKIILLGEPNVGKSSLFNILNSNDNKAIVTDISGTTRDLLVCTTNFFDLPVELIDTAGINYNTEDKIEKIGVKNTINEIKNADTIFLIYQEENKKYTVENIFSSFSDEDKNKVIFIKNKCDNEKDGKENNSFKIGNQNYDEILISVLKNKGIDILKNKVQKKLNTEVDDEMFSANNRHMQSLSVVYNNLIFAKENLIAKQTDLLAEDIKMAVNELGNIVGEYSTDNLLADIFSNFCIGK
jgi:tRNA modification GTPase